MKRKEIHPSAKVKVLLVLLNIFTGLIAIPVYLPLAMIQEKYDRRCFLFVTVQVMEQRLSNNSTLQLESTNASLQGLQGLLDNPNKTTGTFTFDPERSKWPEEKECNLATFGPVLLQIGAIMTGWCLQRLWPVFEASGGNGSVLFSLGVLYSVMAVVASRGVNQITEGLSQTCKSMKKFDVQCTGWNHQIKFESIFPGGFYDIMETMHYVQKCMQILYILEGLKVFFCFAGYFSAVWDAVDAHYRFLCPKTVRLESTMATGTVVDLPSQLSSSSSDSDSDD